MLQRAHGSGQVLDLTHAVVAHGEAPSGHPKRTSSRFRRHEASVVALRSSAPFFRNGAQDVARAGVNGGAEERVG